jgi:hypothetical protein
LFCLFIGEEDEQLDGWMDDILRWIHFANGLVDGMKKTCKDGWYFGILSLFHFQGHKCLWMDDI